MSKFGFPWIEVPAEKDSPKGIIFYRPDILSFKALPMNDWESTVKDALRTDLTDAQYEIVKTRLQDTRILKILHAAIGLQTEVGELMDALKRFLFYGKPIDETNLLEEGGDISWYLRLLAANVGTREFKTMILRNIEKLKARYPEKFTEDSALNRNLERERQILSGDPTEETEI